MSPTTMYVVLFILRTVNADASINDISPVVAIYVGFAQQGSTADHLDKLRR
jgi:hypothetical protein